jgi:hypothetical protein
MQPIDVMKVLVAYGTKRVGTELERDRIGPEGHVTFGGRLEPDARWTA